MKRNKILILLSTLLLSSCNSNLPKPEIEDGIRGQQFGIDKNINEKTIDNYLNRDDVCYRDVRMLIDPANYENIGGDSTLSGYIEGFEVVPYPYLAPLFDLPSEVGEGYSGNTLFSYYDNTYSPNYHESLNILENLFPKNMNIFLMCGGGGYANMTKKLLISLGWNKDKIYNVGGYWYYDGDHKVEVDSEFKNVKYHDINFSTLTKIT